MKAIVPMLAALSLAACATTTDPAASERRIAYSCDNGDDLLVVYAGDVARIEEPDRAPIVLRQEPAGSGVSYTSATHTIRGKGDEITYTIGRMVPTTCKEVTPTQR